MRDSLIASQEGFFKSFQPAIDVIREHIKDRDVFKIITHNDSDGVAAGGVLSQLIIRLGGYFKTTCEIRVDDNTIQRVSIGKPKIVIFSDMGGGYLDILEKYLSDSDVIVLDHHLPLEDKSSNIIHINPLLHGFDGGRSISGAGICYLLAKEIDEENVDLSTFGIVGALADQQDKGRKKSLIGLNQIIEKDARNAGLLETHVDLIFYGYETRPIAKACAYTTTPFIPGLSGREDKCIAFLKEANIELKRNGRWRALRDLSEEEKRILFSKLSKHMVYEGCDSNIVHDLVGTIYTLKNEEAWTPLRDGREFASLLNATARMGRPSLGLSICMGDRREAMREAEKILDDYRKKIGEYLDWVRETNKIQEMQNIFTLRAHNDIDDRIIGVIASILLSTGLLRNQKPIVAVAETEEGLLKVSARATETMAEKGLDLGKVMMKAAETFDGRGGGHDIAAGAYLQKTMENRFIDLVDELVQKQFISQKN